jgi:hypothetical protein
MAICKGEGTARLMMVSMAGDRVTNHFCSPYRVVISNCRRLLDIQLGLNHGELPAAHVEEAISYQSQEVQWVPNSRLEAWYHPITQKKMLM